RIAGERERNAVVEDRRGPRRPREAAERQERNDTTARGRREQWTRADALERQPDERAGDEAEAHVLREDRAGASQEAARERPGGRRRPACKDEQAPERAGERGPFVVSEGVRRVHEDGERRRRDQPPRSARHP